MPIYSFFYADCSSLKALEIIRELQKHFPIKRAPMRIRLTIPDKQLPSLMEKIVGWNATVVTKDQSGNQISMVSIILLIGVSLLSVQKRIPIRKNFRLCYISVIHTKSKLIFFCYFIEVYLIFN